MESIKPPRELDFESSNLPLEWRQWKETFTLYIDLAMSDKDDLVKIKMLLYLAGARGRELYKTIKPADEKFDKVLEAFEVYCTPPRNETVDLTIQVCDYNSH